MLKLSYISIGYQIERKKTKISPESLSSKLLSAILNLLAFEFLKMLILKTFFKIKNIFFFEYLYLSSFKVTWGISPQLTLILMHNLSEYGGIFISL
jgi:hypothetical protein